MTTTSFVAELLIDGKGRAAANGATFPNINPYTTQEIGPTPEATVADVDDAVTAARRAFDETKWAEDHQFRGRCITQLREALQRHTDELLRTYAAPQQAVGDLIGLRLELAIGQPLVATDHGDGLRRAHREQPGVVVSRRQVLRQSRCEVGRCRSSANSAAAAQALSA